MTGAELVFYAAAALAIVSALGMVTRKNAITGAVWLIATFFAVAVCYVLLSATFLSAIQVLVYAGAIMVLFVFVIMVLDVDESGQLTHKRPSRVAKVSYYGLSGLIIAALLWLLVGTWARQYLQFGADLSAKPDFGTAAGVGRSLFREYLFAFEAISLLLLAAVVGAVVIPRSRKERVSDARLSAHEALHSAGLSDHPEASNAPPGHLG